VNVISYTFNTSNILATPQSFSHPLAPSTYLLVAFVSTLKYVISNRRYKFMDKNENINLPTKVTITLDLDKLYNELKENGWKPNSTAKYYKHYILKHISKEDTILGPDESVRYLIDLLATISSRHFLSMIEPGPGKDALIKRVIHEYEK